MQQDFLKNLEAAVGSSTVEVYVPSKQQKFSFKPLNLQQQKTLFKTSLDETFTKLQFNVSFYNILFSNSPSNLNLKELYSFDRSAIAVGLRAANNTRPYVLGDLSIDLTSLANTYSNITLNDLKLESQVEDDKIFTKLKAPNLGVDRDVNIFAQNKLKNNKDIQSIITELYSYEIAKYIEYIDIKQSNQKIDFNTISVGDRVDAIEVLPTHIISGVLEFIKPIREFENKFLTSNNVTIEVDGSFFSV